MAGRFNALSVDLGVDATLRPFHDRPAWILGASRFAQAALAQVEDTGLRSLPLIGSLDQAVDSVDLLTSPVYCLRLRALWTG
jgi:hypothetical protein